MSHTPGPWKASLAAVCNEPSRYVITIGKWGAPNLAEVHGEADARLIAAAPELLQTVEDLVDSIMVTPLDELQLKLEAARELIRTAKDEK